MNNHFQEHLAEKDEPNAEDVLRYIHARDELIEEA